MRVFLFLAILIPLAAPAVAATPPIQSARLELPDPSGYNTETQRWDGPFHLRWKNPDAAFRVEWRLVPGPDLLAAWDWGVPVTGPWRGHPAAPGPDSLTLGCLQGVVPGGVYALSARVVSRAGDWSEPSEPLILTVPGEPIAFADTVAFGGGALYAWGHAEAARTLVVRYDAGVLSVNGHPHGGGAYRFTDSQDLLDRYRNTPAFRLWTSENAAPVEAAIRVHAEIEALAREANHAYANGGMTEGLEIFRRSRLVQHAGNPEGNAVEVMFHGVEGHRFYNLGGRESARCVYVDYPTLDAETARGLVTWFEREARKESNAEAVFLLSGGGLNVLTLEDDRREFRKQLEHLEERGVYLLPPGPLTDAMAAEFLTAGYRSAGEPR